jgi:hypothetical protein
MVCVDTRVKPFQCRQCLLCFSRKELHDRHQRKTHSLLGDSLPAPTIVGDLGLPTATATTAANGGEQLVRVQSNGNASSASDIILDELNALGSIALTNLSADGLNNLSSRELNNLSSTSASSMGADHIHVESGTSSMLDHAALVSAESLLHHTHEPAPPQPFSQSTIGLDYLGMLCSSEMRLIDSSFSNGRVEQQVILSDIASSVESNEVLTPLNTEGPTHTAPCGTIAGANDPLMPMSDWDLFDSAEFPPWIVSCDLSRASSVGAGLPSLDSRNGRLSTSRGLSAQDYNALETAKLQITTALLEHNVRTADICCLL